MRLSVPSAQVRFRRLRSSRLVGVVGASALLLGAMSAAPAHAAGTGTLSGVILEASDGLPAANVCAELYPASSTYSPIASACSDGTGHYAITGQNTGQYLVQFVDGDTTRHDIPQWYNSQPDQSSANFVTITDGQTTGNIGASMVAGGWISGTVTNNAATPTPLQDICVNVYDQNDNAVGGLIADSVNASSTYGSVTRQVCTDAQGKYVTGGVPAGTYTVAINTDSGGYVQDSNYQGVWFKGAATQPAATAVAVTVGHESSAIDAALAPVPTATVSGTVTDGSGPVNGATVSFQPVNGGSWVQASTDPSGKYSVDVPAGSWQVKFTGTSNYDAPVWYNNEPDGSMPDTLTVTAGTPITNLNATLPTGGAISGKVTDSVTGKPVPGMQVSVCGTSCPYPVSTGADGTYTIGGLVPGANYTVSFRGDQYGSYDDPTNGWTPANTSAYVTHYYNNVLADDAATPTSVTVNAGATTTSIDDTAVIGTVYSGTVTDKTTGAPLSNICVTPTPTNGGYSAAGSGCTDSTGAFTTYGVPAGTYRLDFNNWDGRYIEQFGPSLTATSTPQTVTGQDTQMVLGGNIAGKITDSSGTPLSWVCATALPTATASDPTTGLSAGCTDANGLYTSPALPAGTYDVQFSDGSGSYATQYFDHSATLAGATPVTVNAGATTGAINGSLTAATVPGKPTGVTAVGDNRAATVNFTAPASDGGSTIYTYVITPTPACPACTGLTSSSTSSTVVGLTNGTSYTFTVAAVNGVGQGADSDPSNAVIPAVPAPANTVPGAPTNVSATADVNTVKVSFAAPANNGGSPITTYTIQPNPACSTCGGLTTSGTSTVVTGLTPGQSYNFSVVATNAVGTGSPSVSSNLVVPTAQAVSPVSSSTSNPSTPAVAANNGTTATASGGTGTVTVSQYPNNPAGSPSYPSNGSFFDANVASGSTFSSVVIKDCNLNGGSQLYWWNPAGSGGGAWQPVVGDPTDTSGMPGCLSVTIDGSSSPTVAQLTGTIFGVAQPPTPQPVPFSQVGSPTISGTSIVGKVLTASPGTWAPAPTAYTYQWMANGVSIPGATGQTLKLVPNLALKKVSVSVTASRYGLVSTTAQSATSVLIRGVFSTPQRPTIAGTAKPGSYLRVVNTRWSPAPALKYQWFRNGRAIRGAVRSRYLLTSADRGARITVRVTGTRTGYVTKSLTSLPRRIASR